MVIFDHLSDGWQMDLVFEVAWMIGLIMEKLAFEAVVGPNDVMVLKRVIAAKYPTASVVDAANMLAEAIRRMIDKHIPQFDPAHRRTIKSRVLQEAVCKRILRISAADILRALLQFKSPTKLLQTQIIQWVSAYQTHRLTGEDVATFVKDFQAQLVTEQPRKLTRTIPDIVEERETPVVEQIRYETPVVVQNIPVNQPMERSLPKKRYGQRIIAAVAAIALFLLILMGFVNFNHWANVDAQALTEENVQSETISSVDMKANEINPAQQPPVVNQVQATPMMANAMPSAPVASPTAEKAETSEMIPSYSQKLVITATAYDLSVASCGKLPSFPGYGRTYSGTRATMGRTIAVDPKVIPLGSKVYLAFPKVYQQLNGVYIAEDTGMAIKGNRIDIFFGEDQAGEDIVNRRANDFGIRVVDAYILN